MNFKNKKSTDSLSRRDEGFRKAKKSTDSLSRQDEGFRKAKKSTDSLSHRDEGFRKAKKSTDSLSRRDEGFRKAKKSTDSLSRQDEGFRKAKKSTDSLSRRDEGFRKAKKSTDSLSRQDEGFRKAKKSTDSLFSSEDARPKMRAGKAKRMVLRQPNQKIQKKSEFLREMRQDLSTQKPLRLQKILAASGAGSRRDIEEKISAGHITINGRVATLGARVTPEDEVKIQGKMVRLIWPDRLPRILLYYKQEGELVSRDDPEGRLTVFDRLPQLADSRWIVIGRLDMNTAGLLIFTTSGELANRFAHPSFAVDREYSVRIAGSLSDEQMQQLTGKGIELDDGMARAARIVEHESEGKNVRYDIVVQEGRNREVRRIFEYFGFTISKLTRIRFGPIALPPRLRRGQFYELNEVETAYVLKEMEMPVPGQNQANKARKRSK